MINIFISYSRADDLFVEQLVPLLEQVFPDFEIWYDQHITGGEDWWQRILKAIDACDLFIYLLSNDSLASSYCQAEFREALRLQKVCLPVVVRPKTNVGLAPSELNEAIRSRQWVDMSGGFKNAKANAALFRAVRLQTTNIPAQTPEPLHPTPMSQPSVKQPNKPNRDPTIVAALIGGVAVILAALIGLLPSLLNQHPASASSTESPTTAPSVAAALTLTYTAQTLIALQSSPSPTVSPTSVPTRAPVQPTPTSFSLDDFVAQTKSAWNTSTAIAVASFTKTPIPTFTASATFSMTPDIQKSIEAAFTATALVQTANAIASYSKTPPPMSTVTPTPLFSPTDAPIATELPVEITNTNTSEPTTNTTSLPTISFTRLSDRSSQTITSDNARLVKQLKRIDRSGVVSLSWSGNGSVLAVGYGQQVAIYSQDTDQPTILPVFTPSLSVISVSVSPDGKLVAVGSLMYVYVMDIDTKQKRWQANGAYAKFSPDGSLLAIAGDRFLSINRTSSGDQVIQFKSGNHPSSVGFSSDGTVVALAHEEGIKIWDIMAGTLSKEISPTGGYDVIPTVLFSPTGTQFAYGDYTSHVRILDAKTFQQQLSLGTDGYALSASFSPDGKLLVCGNGRGTIQVWDTTNGNLVNTLVGHGDIVKSVAFSPDGKAIASASSDGTVRIWGITE